MRKPPAPPAATPAPAVEDDDIDHSPPPPEAYDLADYRWVPVRRRPRTDGWTEEKQRRFIEVLADTGLVSLAAKEVGLSRESAYQLRRAPHAAAFARAWDAARHHAGSLLEDVAFERAIEGAPRPIYNEYGDVVCTRHVLNDRLLVFLLRHLRPDRYAREALARPAPPPEPVEAALGALEPRLPAPPAALLDADTLAHELDLAEVADGVLPDFLREQRPRKSPERLQREEWAAEEARGEIANEKANRGEKLDDQEFRDMCRFLDPAGRADKGRKRFR